MKKYILGILIIGLGFTACENPNEKEIGEIEALIAIAEETEKSLLSLDTSRVFATKRQLESDLAEFNKISDTLTREEAYKASDIFGSKKKLYRLTAGYPKFLNQIEISKKQLDNLKQDLENDLIKKENYSIYYAEEQASLNDLNRQINKLVNGIEVVVEKFESDRPELLELIEQIKQKEAANE